MYDKIKMNNVSGFKPEMVNGLKKALSWDMWSGVFLEEEIQDLITFLEGAIFDAGKLLPELKDPMTEEEIRAVFCITDESYPA